MNLTTSVVETKEGRIEYSIRANGKAVLFVHGGHVDCTEKLFQKGFDNGRYRCITPSRPGYGNTPLTDRNKTPNGTADLIVALLDQLGIRKVALVGISAGGLTALAIAGYYPHRVETLTLMSAVTKTWFQKCELTYRGGKFLFHPFVETFTWSFYRVSFKLFRLPMVRIMFKSISDYRPITFTKAEIDQLKQLTFNMRSGQGFVNDLDQVSDNELLALINCPTLIVHSNYDHAVGPSHAQNAKANIQKSRLVMLDNRWGHLIWLGSEYEYYIQELISHVESIEEA